MPFHRVYPTSISVTLPTISSHRTVTRTVPPQLRRGSAAKPPLNPQNRFPEQFVDLRPLPRTVSAHVSDPERGTYYFLYRSLLNFYGVLFLWETGEVEGRTGQYEMALPAEWTQQRLYPLRGGEQEGQPAVEMGGGGDAGLMEEAPLMMSFVRNATGDEEGGVGTRGRVGWPWMGRDESRGREGSHICGSWIFQ